MFEGINEAVKLCHTVSRDAGWWAGLDPDEPMVFATKLALTHSELSEALEGSRKSLMDSHLPHRRAVEVELADAVIRIFDLAGACDMNLEGALKEKMEYNLHREDHKLENRAKLGGKRI